VIIQSYTGEAGNDSADAAFCQFFLDIVCAFCYAAVGICNAFPCGGTYKAVLKFYIFQMDLIKQSFHENPPFLFWTYGNTAYFCLLNLGKWFAFS